MAIVGNIGKSVTRQAYESVPNQDAITQEMIDLTVEQYKKMSKNFNATSMVVSETQNMRSHVGIKFYVSTIHFVEKKPPIALLGTHLVPFEKPYMIMFVIAVVVDKNLKEDQTLYNNIFNSFHLLEEQPVTR
jgi:hypothetical protein